MFNRILLGKILLLLVMLIVVMSGLTVFGCVGVGARPMGWSGGTIADGTLFLGSLEGKIVAINIADGSPRSSEPLKAKQTGGGFGCTPTSTTVAIYGTPAVAGDLVYISGYNGKIYAFNSNSLQMREDYPPENYLRPIVGGPVVSQGKVYFGCSDGKVYALDVVSLEKEWEFETGDKIWSTPAIDDSTLYIGSFDKKLYAIDAITGKEKWEKPFQTEGAITSTPVVYNNTVYIGSSDRHLYAINASNGKQIWQFPVEDEAENKPDNWFWAKPVICNNTVYAPCLDGKVYILNAETGDEVVDAIDLGSPIPSSPVLVGDLVIIASEEGVVYAIDTGSFRKSELKNLGEKIHASLCAGDEIVYIHTQKHETVYALNTRTGVVLWSLPLGSK